MGTFQTAYPFQQFQPGPKACTAILVRQHECNLTCPWIMVFLLLFSCPWIMAFYLSAKNPCRVLTVPAHFPEARLRPINRR